MDNEKKNLPDPPAPPPEIIGAPSPGDPSTTELAPTGPTPQELESAAQSYARWSGEVLDFLTNRKGYQGRTADEKARWLELWREEVAARPFLLKGAGAIPPEAGFLFFALAYVKTRQEWAAAAEAEKKKNEGAGAEVGNGS